MHNLSPQDFLAQMLATQTSSIAKYQFEQQTVWIKKAGKRHSIWLYRFFGIAAKLLKLQALTPVPNLGGYQSILTETHRLQELQQRGINVPELLTYNEEGLMIADVGDAEVPSEQLESALKHSASAEDCLRLYKQVVDEVHRIHQKEVWLSEAFLRNMVFDKNQRIAFLDFESDPGQYMNQQLCFARDWLCLIFSASIYLKSHDVLEQGSSYLYATIQQESKQTQSAVLSATKLFNWLNKLPLNKFGKDGYRLTAVLTVLAYLKALM